MTVLTGYVRDVAEFDDLTVFTFHVPILRGIAGDTGVVTVRKIRVQAEGGVLTTPDLTPGHVLLTVQGDTREYHLEVPNSGSPVLLWPLMQAATGPAPGTPTTGFVVNAGGIARTQAVALADYPGIAKDPATLYALFE